MAGPKIIKDPALSMADKMADTAKAKSSASAKSLGIASADLAAHPHLKQSKHFGAVSTPKNPAGSAPGMNDGLPAMAKRMGKGMIGG